MKRYFSSALACVFAMAMSAQTLFVGTYNVRQHNDGDDRNGNVWTVRSKVIADQINFEDPDAFGTQECFKAQLDDLTRLLDGYGHIGVARDDGKEEGEHSAIFFKKERLKVLRHGDFWLSETPDKPGLGWDAACIRICTWGEFKQRATGFKFFYFNLHMDHVGIVARREAAKLVVKKIREVAKGAPVVLTGDFNVDQKDEIYRIFTESGILKDSYECAAFRFAENGTFSSFDPTLKTDSRIDHVFVSPEFNVSRYGVLTNMYWTASEKDDVREQKGHDAPQEINFKEHQIRTPSDHYPVLVKMNYGK